MPSTAHIAALTMSTLLISFTAYYAHHLIKVGKWKKRRRKVEKDWDDDETEEEKLFSAAIQFIDLNSSLVPQEILLRLYGFFKEATEGPFHEQAEPIPIYSLDMTKRTKQRYWKAASDAGVDPMVGYVALVDMCVPDWRTRGKGVKSNVIENTDAVLDDTPIGQLCDVISRGEIDEVKRIITAHPHLVLETDAEGMSVLHWASDRGDAELGELLLNAGAVALLNAQDDIGMTALHYAVVSQHVEFIPLLIQRGANIHIKDNDDTTPLEAAQGTSVEHLVTQMSKYSVISS